MTEVHETYVAVVNGGGAAGLSAALEIGRDQLGTYDVTLLDGCAVDAAPDGDHYRVRFADGSDVRSRGVVLASGIRDVLPDVPGMAALWGTGVFHCPYCHGWEVAGRPLGVYARGDAALHLSTLLRVWTPDLVLFTDGPTELPDGALDRLRAGGVTVREDLIDRLEGDATLEAVVMQGGDVIPRAGLFVAPAQVLGSDLHERLGCDVAAAAAAGLAAPAARS